MNSKEKEVIRSVAKYVGAKFKEEHTGHDWWHVSRVWKLAKKIAKNEKANNFIVELGALFHDMADHKLGNHEKGVNEVKKLLSAHNLHSKDITHILDIVENTSYKGARVKDKPISLEAKIVQDADRLDAMGAIGIARTFAYGGSKKREIYNPDIKPQMHTSFSEYKNSNAPTINHFYEKLLLLKERMHTESAKQIAGEKHQFMEEFLERFFEEWNG